MISIATLRASGLTNEQILKVLETEQQENLAKARELARVRQRNYRERNAIPHVTRKTEISEQNQQPRYDVTRDHRDHRDMRDSGKKDEQKQCSRYDVTRDDRYMGGSLSSSLLTTSSLDSSLGKKKESKIELVEGRELNGWPLNYFQLFWDKYPNKVGKPRALNKLATVHRRGKVSWSEIWIGLEAYCAKTDDRPWCNPETWINQERWADQPAQVAVAPKTEKEIHREKWRKAGDKLKSSADDDESSPPIRDTALRLLPGGGG